MESVVFGLAALACPVGMGVMMWFMVRGMRGTNDRPQEPQSLEALRAEHRRVTAEIEERERDDDYTRVRERST